MHNPLFINRFYFLLLEALAISLFVFIYMPQVTQAQAAPVTQNITGYLDGLHQTLSPRLYGWAADKNTHQKQLQVQFWYGPNANFIDAKLAGTITANLNSADVLKVTGIKGDHRFSWPIPSSFSGSEYYWFTYALGDGGKKIPLLKSPVKISIPANAFQTVFTTPTANTSAVIGKVLNVTWVPISGIPGIMKIRFTDGDGALFPEPSVRYTNGEASLNLTGCTAFSTAETLNCRTLRARISSGLQFLIEGVYIPSNSAPITIKSKGFKASYPKDAHATCYVNGTYVQSGESKMFYSAQSATTFSCSLLGQMRKCENGVMTGDSTKYKHATCTSHQACTLDGATIQDGQKRTFYSSVTPTSGGRCTFNAEERTCTNGILSGALKFNKASCTETIMDYNAVWAPTKTPKMLGIYKDTNFAPDTGRILRYYINANGIVQASYDKVQSSVQRGVFQSSKAVIGNWLGNPSLISPDTKIITGPNTMGLSIVGSKTGNVALSLIANGDITTLRARSHEQMIGEFGSLFFPSKNDVPALGEGSRSAKIIFLPAPLFSEPIKLNDFSTINFKVDATLKKADIKTDCVLGTPPTLRAQNCYDPKLHATQFRVAFGNVQWTDARCLNNNPADPICKNHGKFLYFVLGLFDERNEYISGFLQDRPTASWIYRINLRDFIAGKPDKNPFKIIGKRSIAQGDILAIMKKQVLAAEKLGYVPPRLSVNGVLETDEQYLDHYAFSSTNVGYENTGISDITFDINDLTIVGTRSGLPQSPSCEITITPDSITRGQSATLSWKTALANSFSVNRNVLKSTAAKTGSVTIYPTETTGYEGTATGLTGHNKCRTIIQVK